MEETISLEGNLAGYLFRVVNESIARRQLDISDEARAYIVFLADRFFGAEKFHSSDAPLTFRLADAGQRRDGTVKLQYLGDECLFLTGYFRPFVERSGNGQVEYVSAIGTTAYKVVGKKRDPFFLELATKFPELSDVLGDIHTIKPVGEFTDEEIKRLAHELESLKNEKIIFPEGLN